MAPEAEYSKRRIYGAAVEPWESFPEVAFSEATTAAPFFVYERNY